MMPEPQSAVERELRAQLQDSERRLTICNTKRVDAEAELYRLKESLKFLLSGNENEAKNG